MELRSNQVAVITGAASGIGEALAIALDKKRLQLVLVDIERNKLEEVSAKLQGEPLLFEVDVSDAESMMDLGSEVFARYDNVHLLVSNAGVMGPMAPIWELEDSDWEWVFNVNVKGTAHGFRSFVPRMIAQEDPSHIVVTASEASFSARAFVGVYHSSKHAVLAMTETLAQELEFLEEKIRVSVLCPGAVDTQVMKADRNRPEELAKISGSHDIGDKLLKVYQRSIEQGLSADNVAQVVIQGITENRFYLLPHQEVMELPALRAIAVREDNYPRFDPNLARLVR